MKKAIIFDCDGTLFDSEKVSKEAFRFVASKINIDLNEDFFNRIMGTTYNHICNELKNYPGMLERFPEVAKVWEEMIIEKTKIKDSLAKKGLHELLGYLEENDYSFAIASSSKIDHIERLIKHLSKEYTFKAIIPGDSIKNSKPAPDIFLKAASVLNVLPSECIVVEDSLNGVKAAKNANMTTIFIEDEVKFKTNDYQYVDYQFDNLSQIISFLENNK